MQPRCGFVGLGGEPNAGKSTLMNRLLGEKLAIVSPKPQTTWNVVRGILTAGPGQIIFIDTPGWHRPDNPVGERLVAVAGRALSGADLIYWLVDCRRKPELSARLFPRRPAGRVPAFLLLNKIDLIARPRLLPLIDYFQKLKIFREIIPLSALKGENVEQLLELTWPVLPAGRPLFDPELLSDQPERELLREFIRERIFLLTNQEIPYSSAVKIETVREGPERRKIFVQAVVYVERESQKGILIGKKGAMIKKIGQAARRRMENFLARPVFLDLRIKVRPNWRKNPAARRELL